VITESIEIARPPEEVFAYLNQLERHGEWQGAIIESRLETEGPVRLGTRATDVRRVPGGKQAVTYEITEYEPPRRTAFRGVKGPVRPIGTVTVEPLEGGARSLVTLELDLQGHGWGKLVAPMARRQARKELPGNQKALKERLEAGV